MSPYAKSWRADRTDFSFYKGRTLNDATNPLRTCLESGHFAVTAELTPPRGSDFSTFALAADILKPAVTAINLTDGAGARISMSSLPAAIFLKQSGVEPIMQMTCRDRNRIAIQSDLLGAAAFGIMNLLALTGDGVDAGDDPEAKAVFDFGSTSLLSTQSASTSRHSPVRASGCAGASATSTARATAGSRSTT